MMQGILNIHHQILQTHDKTGNVELQIRKNDMTRL